MMSRAEITIPPADVVDVSCPTCGQRAWSLSEEVRRVRRGLFKGHDFVCKLRCQHCGTEIGAGWGADSPTWLERRAAAWRRRKRG
jgi:hypothetical protein